MGQGCWCRWVRVWHSASFESFMQQRALANCCQQCCPPCHELNSLYDVNLLAREALFALGNHLSRGTLLLLSSSANVTETIHKANSITEFQMYINKVSMMFSTSLKVRVALCGWVSQVKQLCLWVICEEENWFQLVLARASQHKA